MKYNRIQELMDEQGLKPDKVLDRMGVLGMHISYQRLYAIRTNERQPSFEEEHYFKQVFGLESIDQLRKEDAYISRPDK